MKTRGSILPFPTVYTTVTLFTTPGVRIMDARWEPTISSSISFCFLLLSIREAIESEERTQGENIDALKQLLMVVTDKTKGKPN